MYTKVIAYIVCIIGVTLLDIGGISGLPFGLHRLHLLPLAIVFAVLLGNIRGGAWWVLGGGLLMEAFGFNSYGWYFLALFIVLGIVYFLFEKVFTNRSLYSVSAVAVCAVLAYDLVMLVRDYTAAVPVQMSWAAVGNEIIGLALNVVLAIALFYLSNAATRRLRPVFLPMLQRR